MEDGPFPEHPGRDIAGSDIAGSDIAGSDIAGSDIAGSDIAGSDIAGSDIAGSDIAGSDIAGRDIAGRDILEHGGRSRHFPALNWRPNWRGPKSAGVLAAATLVIGLAVGAAAGYHLGDGHGRASAAAQPRPSVLPLPSTPSGATAPRLASPATAGPAPATPFSFAGSPALTQDVGACSVQHGKQLQLGVQVTNMSPATLALTGIKPVTPIGGLRPVSWQWGPCGALPNAALPDGALLNGPAPNIALLPPGASIWLSVTFKVLDGCPAAFPVQFSVGYTGGGKSATASLPGFPDLGGVPYTGCPTT